MWNYINKWDVFVNVPPLKLYCLTVYPFSRAFHFEYLNKATNVWDYRQQTIWASWWLIELEPTVSIFTADNSIFYSTCYRGHSFSPHVILEKQTGVISAAHPHMLGSLEVQHIWGQSGGNKRDAGFYVQTVPDFSFYYRGWCTHSLSFIVSKCFMSISNRRR